MSEIDSLLPIRVQPLRDGAGHYIPARPVDHQPPGWQHARLRTWYLDAEGCLVLLALEEGEWVQQTAGEER